MSTNERYGQNPDGSWDGRYWWWPESTGNNERELQELPGWVRAVGYIDDPTVDDYAKRLGAEGVADGA